MSRNYVVYLKDILGALESIEAFVAGMAFEAFEKDDKTSSAVVRKFEIIGEATKQLPVELRQAYPLVPWKEMAGMRDRLIHFYSGVDLWLLWDTIQKRLPDVKAQITDILEEQANPR